MRLAILDVGSNTVHLVVDGQPDGTFITVARERETLRLAEVSFPTMMAEKFGASKAAVHWSDLRPSTKFGEGD